MKPCRCHLLSGPVLGIGLAIVLGSSLGPVFQAQARDVLFIYGGYADDNAYDRTLEQAEMDHPNDRVIGVLDAYDLDRTFADLLVVEGESEVIGTCDSGMPPDLKLLEKELERLKQDLDFEGMIFAYNVAIEELACAGDSLTRQDAASLYVERGMVHFKNSEVELARVDFGKAFILDPSHAWDRRHTPKAESDFEAVRDEIAGEYSYALFVAEDGPYGSGVAIDGVTMRPGQPMRLLAGEHLISWRGGDEIHSGILEVWSTATLIGAMGLFDFLFRDPRDMEEEKLQERVLEEIRIAEDVDDVVLLEPVFVRGSLAKRGRFSSPGRAAFAGGYSRYSYFDYGNFHADLWLRIYNVLHAEMTVQFDMTSGRQTGGVIGEPDPEEEETVQITASDYYMMPSVSLGVGGRVTHGDAQPGGGMGIRLHFTGPSLILMPTLVFHGGVDLRPWEPPIVLRINLLWGVILTDGSNDSAGRDLEWGGGGRGIFNVSFGFGFIL